MKKFTFLNIILTVIFVLFISMPAFAGSIHVKDNNIMNGSNNTGIQGNKNHHNTIIGGNLNTGVNAGGSITNTATGGTGGKGGNAIIKKGAIKNINKNTNIQGQAQKQAQGQVQGQTQSANNEGVSQTTVFNEAETKREHHTGTPVSFASLGTYSESKYAGANFQSAKIMTMFKDEFSYEGALEVYGAPFGKGLCETVGKSYNGRHEDDPTQSIKVFTMDDKIIPGSIKSIGFLTVKAVPGKDATSFVVMQKCILSAAIMQGDAIIVTKEGAETITKTSGWGIGFNTSGSMINDMENRGRSAAASGGTGYSSGKGSLEVLPWMTVQVLKFQ